MKESNTSVMYSLLMRSIDYEDDEIKVRKSGKQVFEDALKLLNEFNRSVDIMVDVTKFALDSTVASYRVKGDAIEVKVSEVRDRRLELVLLIDNRGAEVSWGDGIVFMSEDDEEKTILRKVDNILSRLSCNGIDDDHAIAILTHFMLTLLVYVLQNVLHYPSRVIDKGIHFMG